MSLPEALHFAHHLRPLNACQLVNLFMAFEIHFNNIDQDKDHEGIITLDCNWYLKLHTNIP